ncbi:MAG: tRNA (adenosine(37)-N6)-threonylcarbamoyltransferase complex ATPase subunit type 1 TsaE, partial [Aquiluna sp.]
MTQLAIETSEQMEEFGKALAGKLQAGDLLLLAGPLGAGKTTLTRGIGAGLGAEGTVQRVIFCMWVTTVARRSSAVVATVPSARRGIVMPPPAAL